LFRKRLVKAEVKFFPLELKNQGGRRFIPALKDRVFAPSAEINRALAAKRLSPLAVLACLGYAAPRRELMAV
jgi:hypothetical protein